VRWDYFKPRDEGYAVAASGTVMMLAARIAADVGLYRAKGSPPAGPGPGQITGAWPDEPLLALHGLTPREAARADTPYVMLLESMLRQFEYQAASGPEDVDVTGLRSELGMGGN
jgi:hypothetical protein